MKLRFALAAALLMGASFAAVAQSAEEKLAASKACLSCHAVDKKVLGPAYTDVAAKYAGQPDAVDKLVKSVKEGSKGTWGPVPMPANAQVTEAEAKTLVTWILTLKK